MGACFSIVNYGNTEKIEGIIYTNQQREKTACCSESQILLEVIRSIEKGTRGMLKGKMTIYVDNKKLKNTLSKIQHRVNYFFQEAGAIIGKIQEMRKKVKLTIKIEYTKEYPEKQKNFKEEQIR